MILIVLKKSMIFSQNKWLETEYSNDSRDNIMNKPQMDLNFLNLPIYGCKKKKKILKEMTSFYHLSNTI